MPARRLHGVALGCCCWPPALLANVGPLPLLLLPTVLGWPVTGQGRPYCAKFS